MGEEWSVPREDYRARQQPGALGHPREGTVDFMLKGNKLSQESDMI